MIFNKSPPFILSSLLNIFKQIFDIDFEPLEFPRGSLKVITVYLNTT